MSIHTRQCRSPPATIRSHRLILDSISDIATRPAARSTLGAAEWHGIPRRSSRSAAADYAHEVTIILRDPMSEPPRPTPIQPSLLTNAHSSMAQVQSLPVSSFLGRPEHRPSFGVALPPLQAAWPSERSLPRIQLPPLQLTATPGFATTSRPMGIENLLANSPPFAAGSHPTPIAQQPLHRQMPNARTPSSEERKQHALHQSVRHQHREAPSAPASARQPQRALAIEPPHYAHPPQSYRQHAFESIERQQYSPAVTSVSSATSFYDSEPSPRASIGPGSGAPTGRIS